MMTDTAVCEACGADVRNESLFCYNCGGRLVTKPDVPSPAVLADHVEEVAVAAPHATPPAALPGAKPPMRSAASLRGQRRAFSRQPVEVTWERPTGLGIGFIVTTILLAVAAFVLMAIALYLR